MLFWSILIIIDIFNPIYHKIREKYAARGLSVYYMRFLNLMNVMFYHHKNKKVKAGETPANEFLVDANVLPSTIDLLITRLKVFER